MSDVVRRVRDGWAHIAAGRSVEHSGSWTAFDTGVPALDRKILLARDDFSGLHLLVPSADLTYTVPRQGQVLSTSTRSFDFGAIGAGSFLDVCCSDPAFAVQFMTVSEDVVDRVTGTMSPAQVAIGVVAEWRQLFASAISRPLSYQKRISLFAELSALLEVAQVCGTVEAQWWTGPDGAPHDIEHERFSVEVKAIGIDSDSIRINGIAQLESEGGKDLYLSVMPIAESENGLTLRDLADRVLDRSANTTDLRQRMTRAGVFTPDESADVLRFEVGEGFVVRVDHETPRIVPSLIEGGVDPAINRVRYDIELESIAANGVFAALSTELEGDLHG